MGDNAVVIVRSTSERFASAANPFVVLENARRQEGAEIGNTVQIHFPEVDFSVFRFHEEGR